MVYASEKEDDNGDAQTLDITNEAFWRKLASIFEETKQLMADWAEDARVDLSQVDEAANEQRQRRSSDAARDELAIAPPTTRVRLPSGSQDLIRSLTSLILHRTKQKQTRWNELKKHARLSTGISIKLP